MKCNTLFRLIALSLVLLLLPGLAPPASAASGLPPEDPFARALSWAEAAGIADPELDPETICTRGDAAALLWRYDHRPGPGGSSGAAENRIGEASGWALELGLLEPGADGSLGTELPCTRIQLVTALWRYAGSPAVKGRNPFSDLPDQGDAPLAVTWALQAGITRGTGSGRFSPDQPCTCGQALWMLYRADCVLPRKRLIVLDPGHQLHANADQEPNGPGSSLMKAKVSGGTYGAASGLAEYQLTLAVSLQLRQELERRGYRVLLTRDRHDVDLSNVDRASFANAAGADAVIRIHANGSDDTTLSGAMALNMTRENPYNGWLYEDSRALSEAILEGFCAATGANRRPIWDTDTMTGINWSQVPVTILEMGYMTNPAEDLNMASPAYQASMVRGIADGLDAYFTGRAPVCPLAPRIYLQYVK